MSEYKVLSLPSPIYEEDIPRIVEMLFDKAMVETKDRSPELCCSNLEKRYEECGVWEEALLDFIHRICRYRLISVDRGTYYFKEIFAND